MGDGEAARGDRDRRGRDLRYHEDRRDEAPGRRARPRYLRYDGVGEHRAGMHHVLRNLQWLMREAFMCGRLAVLPPLMLHPKHNLGRPDGLGQWDVYYDLDASGLICPSGRRHPLPIARQLPERALRTLTLSPGARMPAQADGFELVVRRVYDKLHLRDTALDPVRRLLGDVLAGPPRIGFEMRPSARVRELAEPVIASITERYGAYAAVHIRRGDVARRIVERRTKPTNVRKRLARLGIADGDVVFFLSNERDPEYWREFGRFYDIVRYTDFAELAALVSEDGGRAPDNYLLYEVEKAIMRRAACRVETIPGPNYTPSHGTLIGPWEWTLAGLAYRCVSWARDDGGDGAEDPEARRDVA